jgi:hypothetical protein
METKVNSIGGVQLAAALIGVVCAGAVGAQQAPAGGANLPDPRVQAASCEAVAWDRELLARYPRMAEGCQEVVASEGAKWARFEADFVQNNRDGSVTLNFKDRQGRSMERLTMLPAPEQRVLIAGRNYRFSELTRGQALNLYVPEGIFALACAPGAPPQQLAKIVPESTVVAEVPPAQPAQPVGGSLLAQVDRAQRAGAQVLPRTAGPLPLVDCNTDFRSTI